MFVDSFKNVTQATLDIFYPNQCEICSVDLNSNESHLCLQCSYDLPYLSNSSSEHDQLNKLFWGRVEVKQIYSLFNYQKGNQVQDLLHLIKYQKKTKLAQHLGERLAADIKDKSIDLIIPVPLHPKKLRKRGFNQSSIIAKGIKNELAIPVSEKLIKRVKHNPSQTTVTKYDRWENVKSIFAIPNPKKLIGKHILLVDDVLTTGATLEACIKPLIGIEDCKVSVATLAARV